MTGIKYQESDDYGSVLHTSFVRDFAAMHSVLYIRLSEPGAA